MACLFKLHILLRSTDMNRPTTLAGGEHLTNKLRPPLSRERPVNLSYPNQNETSPTNPNPRPLLCPCKLDNEEKAAMDSAVHMHICINLRVQEIR